jgi:serine-type D-Ala-D-Ala carboxypeptidase (penicillin-binding protein 5/6)
MSSLIRSSSHPGRRYRHAAGRQQANGRSAMSAPRRPRGVLSAASVFSGTLWLLALAAVAAGPAASASPAAAARSGHARPALRPASHPPPGILARQAEIYDLTRNARLWGRNIYTAAPIASLTKVMTALVVIKAGDLDRHITITKADENYLGCCIAGAGLIPGDVLTARQLLYAVLLPSGADAARALAISYGPGWHAFVRKMNATARALHLRRTRFTNFDGVKPTDVSSPRNLLLLGEAAMRHPLFKAIVGRRQYRVRSTARHHAYVWRNRNVLLGDYPGAIGIKTGWIPQAGECLLFEAVRNGRVLIGVVLDSGEDPFDSHAFADARTLLNWGFGQHRAVSAGPDGIKAG